MEHYRRLIKEMTDKIDDIKFLRQIYTLMCKHIKRGD